jgi:hypothetical protein
VSESSNRARLTYNVISFGSIVLITAIAFVILVGQDNNPVTSIFVALGWGIVPVGLAWGVAETVAPSWVIRLRARLITGVNDWRKPVGDYFSKKFATTGPEPWRGAVARHRVRLLGVALTTFWVLFIGLLLWLPSHLDAF